MVGKGVTGSTSESIGENVDVDCAGNCIELWGGVEEVEDVSGSGVDGSDLCRFAGRVLDVSLYSRSRFGDGATRDCSTGGGTNCRPGEGRFLSIRGSPQPHFLHLWPMCCRQILCHKTSSFANNAQGLLTCAARHNENASR